MKYIVLTVTTPGKDREQPWESRYPIIFPNTLVHAHVAKVMELLLGLLFPRSTVTVTSAGELNSADITAQCYGESTSIGVKSKPTEDTQLVIMNDYGAGMM